MTEAERIALVLNSLQEKKERKEGKEGRKREKEKKKKGRKDERGGRGGREKKEEKDGWKDRGILEKYWQDTSTPTSDTHALTHTISLQLWKREK